MKKTLILSVIVLGLVSCEKFGFFHKEKECPQVSRAVLPVRLIQNFDSLYPGATSAVWYNKDDKNYVALFTFNNVETKVVYDMSGNFITQLDKNQPHMEGQKHPKHHDCGCEIEGEEKHHH